MSKELIVSATRHETRVAVLEDDQVVEIFHQREKEYSLAGSIHKGRVTRVLPGMQSAFVDIGLERDAFLYVSDFFEDNDEYDKIVSTVEDKVLRLEKEGGGGVGGAVAEAPVPNGVESIAALPVAPMRREERVEAPRGDRGGGDRSGGDRGGDRSGGRGGRGRRRRGGGRGPQGQGGGIPDSKYFTPRQQTSEPPSNSEVLAASAALDENEPAGSAIDELIVLPGESLAKYTGESREEAAAEVAREAESFVHEAELFAGETEDLESEPEAAAPAAASQEAAAAVAAEPAQEVEIAIVEVYSAKVAEEPVIEQPANSASETFLEAQDFVADEPLDEALEAAAGEEAAEGLAEEGLAEESLALEPEGPEPARIPTSLTATLREQGPRFQHRVSRRVRRKMRGGQGEGRPQQEGRSDQPQVREARAPEGRPEQTRPEPIRNEPREPRNESRSEPREDSRARPVMPSISDLLHEGQEIIVQIAKEPLGQKGARITSHVALPGRFLVYMPSVDHVGVSRKIPSDEERLRLKKILQTHRTGIPGGFIVRTAGEGRSEEELRADMMFLANLWMDMRQKAERKPAPQLMHHDLDVVQRILRDQLTSAFKTVWVDNEELYESVLRFAQRFQPAMVGRIKLYTRPAPIFDEFGITAELEKALRPKVWLKSGGYIVINQTEALVAIDINTGKYVGKSNRLEDTIVKTNTDAVKEIVRQIRLRDLGGIIVVDFIDMDERKNRQKVMLALEEAMRVDRAPYKILQFNDFGLVAITRKRVKQSLERTLCAPCPYCEGAGYIKSVQTVVGEILIEAHKMARLVDDSNVILRVNPEVAKVLKSNQNDFLQEIEETLGKSVIIKSDPLLHQTKFDLA